MIMISKEECEMNGGEWVRSYRKSDGTLVRSYCKHKAHKEIPLNKRDEKYLKKLGLLTTGKKNGLRVVDTYHSNKGTYVTMRTPPDYEPEGDILGHRYLEYTDDDIDPSTGEKFSDDMIYSFFIPNKKGKK